MNPLSRFAKPKGISVSTVVIDETEKPPVLRTEYIPAPEKCFCKVCKIHWTQPKAHVSACKMARFGHQIVWLCIPCFSKIHNDPKVEIPEVSPTLQAPYNEAPKPPQIPVAKPKLPFKKLTK